MYNIHCHIRTFSATQMTWIWGKSHQHREGLPSCHLFIFPFSTQIIRETIDSSAKSLKELFFWFLFSRKFILCLIPLSRFLIRSNFEFNLLEWFDQRRRDSVKSRSEVFHLSLDWISICLSDLKCQVGISCPPPSSPDSAFLSKSIRSFYTSH